MNYLFWDTERIRNSKIYLLGYILTDEHFETIKTETIIDLSIDVSKRNVPRRKVANLAPNSTLVKNFQDMIKIVLPLIENSVSVCFGKHDFLSLNDQLKIKKQPIVSGEYYDVEKYAKSLNENFPTNLSDVASFLNIEHTPHNPLSDSYVTKEYFKFLIERFDILNHKYPIPNSQKILDITVNPTKT